MEIQSTYFRAEYAYSATRGGKCECANDRGGDTAEGADRYESRRPPEFPLGFLYAPPKGGLPPGLAREGKPVGEDGLASTEGVTALLEEKVMGKIKARFEEVFGAREIDPFDPSPEATAKRIVRFATGFFGAYAGDDPKSEEMLDEFLGIVKGAIDQGIGEAESILGSTSETIGETKEYIAEYLDLFREETLRKFSEGNSPEEE